ncbi:hypothetical protein Tco_0719558 [Tanacetum coccineum]
MSSYSIPHGSTNHSSCSTLGQILLDHPLSYALTATTDVPAMYLQQFWKTVSKVPDTKDTIRFKLDTQEIVYTVDMFRDTLKLPMETLDNPFIALVNIEIIESFMNKVGYQGVVDKVSTFYTKFLAQPWQIMFKVFNRCLTTRTSRHDQTTINILQFFHVVINCTHVDYAAPLWWDFVNCVFQKKDVIQYPRFTMFIITNLMKKYPSISPRLEEDYHSIKDDIPYVTVRRMLIPDAFLTDEIRATDDYKEYETLFVGVVVEGGQDDESYASKFAASMLNDDDDDDFGNRLEPGSHKKILKVVDDDDVVNVIEKKDDKKMMRMLRKQMISPRKDLSSDKIIFEELTANVSPTTTTTPKHSSKSKSKKGFMSNKTKILPGSIAGMCRRRGQIHTHIKTKFVTHEFFMGKIKEVLDHCNNIVPELTFAKTNEAIKEEMLSMVDLAVQKDRELASISVPELISKEFATHGPRMIEELFRIFDALFVRYRISFSQYMLAASLCASEIVSQSLSNKGKSSDGEKTLADGQEHGKDCAVSESLEPPPDNICTKNKEVNENCSSGSDHMEDCYKQVNITDLLCAICKELLSRRPVCTNCGPSLFCEACVIDSCHESCRCPKNMLQRERQAIDKLKTREQGTSSAGMSLSLTNFVYQGRQKFSKVVNVFMYPMIDYLCPDVKAHFGVGCDCCGIATTVLYSTGRFNQQHKPDHEFEVLVSQRMILLSPEFFPGDAVDNSEAPDSSPD